LEFWSKVEDFRSISNKAVLASRANTLFSKYLAAESKSYVALSSALLARISAELETPKTTTFNAAQVCLPWWLQAPRYPRRDLCTGLVCHRKPHLRS
jgi:hypothetical protein